MDLIKYPSTLDGFLDGTPLSLERLKLAWPGLSLLERTSILGVLFDFDRQDNKKLLYRHHINTISDLALKDENAYLRYLAAKHVDEPEVNSDAVDTQEYIAGKARFDAVNADSVMLVRYAREEYLGPNTFAGPDDPKTFWELPHVGRLASINGIFGKEIAHLLRYASKELLPTRQVTQEEMLDVLLQYLKRKENSQKFADYANGSLDGMMAIYISGDLKALWELIPDIPLLCSHPLITLLPEDRRSGIPPHVIEYLMKNEKMLVYLLKRDDIALKELRRKLYLSKDGYLDILRWAAISSHNFELLDSDLAELVLSPQDSISARKNKVEELKNLALFCEAATLVQNEAIRDLIKSSPDISYDDSKIYTESCKKHQSERAKRLSNANWKSTSEFKLEQQLQQELFEMRVYEFSKKSKEALRMDYPYLPELKEYCNLSVANNPWQTYLNLTKVITLRTNGEFDSSPNKKFDFLPQISIEGFDILENKDKSN